MLSTDFSNLSQPAGCDHSRPLRTQAGSPLSETGCAGDLWDGTDPDRFRPAEHDAGSEDFYDPEPGQQPDAGQRPSLLRPMMLVLVSLLTGHIQQRPLPAPRPQAEPAVLMARAEAMNARLEVGRAVVSRLAIARDVALAKRAAGLPVHNPQRERLLLEQLQREGEKLGVDPARTAEVFTAQFAASRALQEYWLERWENDPPAEDEPIPDLAEDIRPRITAASRRLLEAVPAFDSRGPATGGWQQILMSLGRVESRRLAHPVPEAIIGKALAPFVAEPDEPVRE